jgi:hypothetical protein
MTQVIIYNQDNGVVAVIIPTPEALEQYGIEAIAAKDVPGPKTIYDVPTGVFETDEDTGENYEVMGPRVKTYPYKIVDAADIPSDRSERNAWTVDEADLTDGIGGESNEFEEAADIPFSPIVDVNGNQFISTTSLLSHCVQEQA